jgi:hypothetical protein
MSRRQQQLSSNRTRTSYIRSVSTDEHISSKSNSTHPISSIKRVKHPADRSSIVVFLQHLAELCLTLCLSLPCVVFLTLLLPISWLIRTLIRFSCRYRCTVTPCTCSYLSASDLFWLYNRHSIDYDSKHDERRHLHSPSLSPVAAAIFYLEGNHT